MKESSGERRWGNLKEKPEKEVKVVVWRKEGERWCKGEERRAFREENEWYQTQREWTATGESYTEGTKDEGEEEWVSLL